MVCESPGEFILSWQAMAHEFLQPFFLKGGNPKLTEPNKKETESINDYIVRWTGATFVWQKFTT